MSEAQRIYLTIYMGAISGWLANKWANQGDQTAEMAHKIADEVAKRGTIAVVDIAKDDE
jgi:hypothetical protein